MATKTRRRKNNPAQVYTVNSVSPLHFRLVYAAWLAGGWKVYGRDVLDGHAWRDMVGIQHMWLRLSGAEVAVFIENPQLPDLSLEDMAATYAC